MTTREVCEKTKATVQVATRWAKLHKLPTVQLEGRLVLTYSWTDEDLENFINRPKAGRKLGVRLKPESERKVSSSTKRKVSFSSEELKSALEMIQDSKE